MVKATGKWVQSSRAEFSDITDESQLGAFVLAVRNGQKEKENLLHVVSVAVLCCGNIYWKPQAATVYSNSSL